LVVDSIFLTPNIILRTYADKEASHFDADSDKNIDKVRQIIYHQSESQRINEVQRFLALTAEYIQNVGKQFIIKLSKD
jgi:hypothetical protein